MSLTYIPFRAQRVWSLPHLLEFGGTNLLPFLNLQFHYLIISNSVLARNQQEPKPIGISFFL